MHSTMPIPIIRHRLSLYHVHIWAASGLYMYSESNCCCDYWPTFRKNSVNNTSYFLLLIILYEYLVIGYIARFPDCIPAETVLFSACSFVTETPPDADWRRAQSRPPTAELQRLWTFQEPSTLHTHRPLRSHSNDIRKLLVPRTHNKLGDRSFSAAGPRLWNDLLSGLRQPGLSFYSFRRSLKTHLFGNWSA